MDFLKFENTDNIGSVKLCQIWPNSLVGVSCRVLKPSVPFSQYHPSDITFISGVIRDDFFQCPLQIGHTTFSEIQIKIDRSKYLKAICNTELIVSDINNKEIRKAFSWVSSTYIDGIAKDLSNIINTLNRFINYSNNLEAINWNKLHQISQKLYPYCSLEKILYKNINDIINNLNIESYSDSSSRVGRDNHFWNETFISNLPKEEYEKKLLYESLKTHFPELNSITHNDNNIFIISDSESFYGPSHQRMKVNGIFSDELKLILKMDIARNYNEEERDLFLFKELFAS